MLSSFYRSNFALICWPLHVKVSTEPFDSTYQRKIAKGGFNNAVESIGLGGKIPGSKRKALLEELQLNKLETKPEIEASIRDKKLELAEAKRNEEDASIICIGHRAAQKTHELDEHPIKVTFDAAYIKDGELWANANIQVTGTVPDRVSDIMLVVDTSAAMKDMLPMVKRSLLDLVDIMEPVDRLGLVMFNHNAKCAQEWTAMDREGKQEIRQKINNLKAGGTSLCKPAVDLALQRLAASNRAKAIATVVMIAASDPQDAKSVYALGKDIPCLVREGVSIDFTTTMTTIGLGSKHNSELLCRMAASGHGPYLFAENEKMLSEQFGRIIAHSRTTVVSGMHCMFEGCAPCKLLEVEPGYGVSRHELDRNSSYFRTRGIQTMEVGSLHVGQQRNILFKLQLESPESADKTALYTPLARMLTIYTAGDNEPHLHHHTIRAIDLPRLACKKPIQAGLPLRFVLEGDVTTMDTSIFQHGLVEALAPHFEDVRKGYFPLDGCEANIDAFDAVHKQDLAEDKNEVVLDLRFNKEDPALAAAVVTKVAELFEDGSLQMIIHAKLREAELDHKLVDWKVPGEETLRRLSQVELCKALEMMLVGDEQGANASLSAMVKENEFLAIDPSGNIQAMCQAQKSIAYNCWQQSKCFHALRSICSSQQQQHPTVAASWPPLQRYETPAAWKRGRYLAEIQCEREKIPHRMEPVSAERCTSSSMKVAWGEAEGNGSPITKYTLRLLAASSGTEIVREYQAPRTTCCVDDLAPDTYFVAVCGSNSLHEGPVSNATMCTVTASADTEVPFVKASMGDENWKWYPGLKLWERMPDTSGDGSWPPRITPAQCIQQQIPSCPSEVVVNASSSNSIEVMWEQVPENGEPVTEYTLVAVEMSQGVQVTRCYDSSVTECSVDNLKPGVYFVSIFASNSVSKGVLSPPVVCNTVQGKKAMSAADHSFEFQIGGVRFRRSAGI
jgi:hypothetical protein